MFDTASGGLLVVAMVTVLDSTPGRVPQFNSLLVQESHVRAAAAPA